MSKFTFICEDDDGVMNTIEFEAELWDDAVINFKQFLRGAGYVFEGDVFDDVFEYEEAKFDLDHLPASNWPFVNTVPAQEYTEEFWPEAKPYDGKAAGQKTCCPCEHTACGVCGCC